MVFLHFGSVLDFLGTIGQYLKVRLGFESIFGFLIQTNYFTFVRFFRFLTFLSFSFWGSFLAFCFLSGYVWVRERGMSGFFGGLTHID